MGRPKNDTPPAAGTAQDENIGTGGPPADETPQAGTPPPADDFTEGAGSETPQGSALDPAGTPPPSDGSPGTGDAPPANTGNQSTGAGTEGKDSPNPAPSKKRIRHDGMKGGKLTVLKDIVTFDENGIVELDPEAADFLLSIPGYQEVKE